MKKKITYMLFLFVFSITLFSCGDKNEEPDDPNPGGKNIQKEVQDLANSLWSTSSVNPSDSKRKSCFDKVQGYADLCQASYFKNYLSSLSAAADNSEKYDPILAFYRISFDKVLEEIKTTQVSEGSAVIWQVYNMGYVVKTPSGCFAIDISHKYAAKLAPYIDFLCVTHNHSDHYSAELNQAMFDAGKPVLSNYLKAGENYLYTSTRATDYTIGKFRITTNMNDHNSTLTNFVTTYQINCGDDTGNFVLMHVGDSNYKASQYSIKENVDVMIIRYAPNAETENNVIGKTLTPINVLMSHIMELAHAGVDESRWTLEQGLERASKINYEQTYMPFWGEKLVWSKSKLH
ncbi:MBL fold metallo-hydrolase [Dysgonomonas sp. ZJ709]|uniref:MBL fold metallo-hydrolase n=1 Tax=Dysgonomonas sp. ZJ709 TaxID=2709797 RepID=UPI0013EC5219|nr:MBL fold metallo-hydrolase [Dysgonomonas sp. ZJ709]